MMKKSIAGLILISTAATLRYIRDKSRTYAWQQNALEQATNKARNWEAIAERERMTRQDYEAALGLSFWSERQVSEELWERAQQGEPLAVEVLKMRTRREAEENAREAV